MTVPQSQRTYFVTFCTDGRRRYLQSTRACELFVETLNMYRVQGHFQIHSFVIMPDHVHMILTPAAGTPLEKAVQLIKGGFYFRAKLALDALWQKCFNEEQIQTSAQYHSQTAYVHLNPVRKRTVQSPAEYEWSSIRRPFDGDPPWFLAAKAANMEEFPDSHR